MQSVPDSPYAGNWVGQTDERRDIGFTVSREGYVTALIVYWRLDLGAATCAGPAVARTGMYPIEGDAFEVPVAFPGSSVTSVVRGTFSADAQSAQGTYDGNDKSFSVLCGDSLTLGSCCALSSATWTAQRGTLACDFTHDGMCDEPQGTGACLAGSDPADCDGDQCAANADDCDDSPNACVNADSAYLCRCPLGFTGDGRGPNGCTDVDECALSPGPCDDDPAAACTNTPGGYTCACLPGSTGSGLGANGCDVDECAQGSDDCDDAPAASCANAAIGFTCSCPSGYTGSGHGANGCTDVDECNDDSDDCDDSPPACVNAAGTFSCHCPASHRGGGVGDGGCVLPVRAVATGINHTCAVLDDGRVKCWGANSYGQLGVGDTSNRADQQSEVGDALAAASLGAGRKALAVAGGYGHTCALLDDGSVKCWGYNFRGQLGLGDTNNRGDQAGEMGDDLPAVNLGTARTAKAIAAGDYHNCALLDDASIKCWGYNNRGQLGVADSFNKGDEAAELGDALRAVDLGTGRSAKAIEAGGNATCALLDDDTIKCWGDNAYGQLGLGDTNSRGDQTGEMGDSLPALDLGTGRFAKMVSASANQACALLNDSSIKCWGYNSGGQLGLGDTNNRGDQAGEMGDSLPNVDLGSGSTALAVDAGGGSHVCALLVSHSVKCWGSALYGQLGLEDTTARGDQTGEMGDNLAAVNLGSERTAAAIAVGGGRSCVLLQDDTLKCWGYNTFGQLGIGSASNRGDQANEMGDKLPIVDVGGTP